MTVRVRACVVSVFPSASGPLPGAVGSQVVGEVLGLAHGFSQVHAVDASHWVQHSSQIRWICTTAARPSERECVLTLAAGAERQVEEQLRLRVPR